MILFEFLRWYYYESPIAIASIMRNFMAFSIDFFGVRYHVATLFRPWHLIVVRFEKESLIKTFFFNLASRFIGSAVGAFMRLITIGIGLFSFIVFFIVGLFVEIIWLFLPLLVVFLFFQGFSYIL